MEKGTSWGNHIWKELDELRDEFKRQQLTKNLSWGTLILVRERSYSRKVFVQLFSFHPLLHANCRIGDVRLPELIGFSLL
jgi:hypothetical protein